jgi:hypothetical protein
VPYEQLGVATSTATFFRSIGGCFGVALFGSVLDNRLFAALPKHLPASVHGLIQGGNISANPKQLDALPPAAHHLVVNAFAHGIEWVFIVAVPFAVAGFVLSLLIKELPLRARAFTSTNGTTSAVASLPTGEVPVVAPVDGDGDDANGGRRAGSMAKTPGR